MKRKSKHITDKKEVEYFVNLTEDDITLSFIMDTFGEFNGKCKYNPYDLITIPPNSYGSPKIKNKNSFVTTVGQWIFNKYFVEKDLFHILGYYDKIINKKTFGKLNTQLSYAIIEDKITLDQFKRYLMKTQKCMPYVSILSPSQTVKMLTSTKEIDKKKKELEKVYAKDIEEGNEIAVEKMQNELIKFSKEYLKDDPSMDSYDSGARGSFGNNFKNMFIMKGAIKDPDPTKGFNIATSNYMNGISKEEYHIFANSLAEGPYKRSKKTELGGYWEKLFVSAFQHLTLDAPGTDCGTKRTLTVKLDDSNISSWMYSYIVEGNRLIELTSDNIDKYIGKVVKMRYSSLCESKTGFCSKCSGNLLYRLGVKNIGLALSILPSTLKNLSMKAFHDSQVVTIEMDPMKAFSLE